MYKIYHKELSRYLHVDGRSYVVMAIVGGAIMPFMMGWLADTYVMRDGFVMPLTGFIYVALYAAVRPWLEQLDTGHEAAD